LNERIKEFVRESNLDVYGLGKERYKWEYTVEKFASLIVKECLINMENCDGDIDFAIWKTKQEYGIEE